MPDAATLKGILGRRISALSPEAQLSPCSTFILALLCTYSPSVTIISDDKAEIVIEIIAVIL